MKRHVLARDRRVREVYGARTDIRPPRHFRIHLSDNSGPTQSLPSLRINHTSLTSRWTGSTSTSGALRSFSRTTRRRLRLAACFSSFSLEAALQPMIGTCRRERATVGSMARRAPEGNARQHRVQFGPRPADD